jgi:hypothetical protein
MSSNDHKSPVPDAEQDELFRSIGMYIYRYSQLDYMLRIALYRLLGLSVEQAGSILPMLDFAAVCRACKAQLQERPDNKKALDLISSALRVNDDRVRVAHGSWTEIGVLHVSRGNARLGLYFSEASELRKKADEIRALTVEVDKTMVPDVRSSPLADMPMDSENVR